MFKPESWYEFGFKHLLALLKGKTKQHVVNRWLVNVDGEMHPKNL